MNRIPEMEGKEAKRNKIWLGDSVSVSGEAGIGSS